MTSTQLPPLNFGDGGFRISIFPVSDIDVPDVLPAELDGRDRDRDRGCEKPKPKSKPKPNPVAVVGAQPEPSHPPPPSPRPPVANVPVHPIPSLQDAFTESLHEVTDGTAADKPKLAVLDPRSRRERLLSQDEDAEPFDATWRYRKGQKQHELFKLIGQISFGVYLLVNGMASSDAQVISILQGHIDEVDEFLQVTLEDLGEAVEDLNGRIAHLKLPLSNIQVFEQLLEDRNFRCEILAGNQRIHYVLMRTAVAVKQWDDDVEAGLQCIAAFTSWLNDEKVPMRRVEVVEVFDAMKGNVDGWLNAFDEIDDRTQEVNNLIGRLTTIIAEVEKKAGEVSRRTWASIPPFSAPPHIPHSPVSGGKHRSVASGGSSRQSHPRLSQQQHPSIHGVSTSRHWRTAADDTDADSIEFPLPGGLPLLPPRSGSRHTPTESLDSCKSNQQPSLRSASSPGSRHKDIDRHGPSSDEPLYVLQPRTYTPQPPELMPSPMLKEAGSITPKSEAKAQAPTSPVDGNTDGTLKKKGSIRHRISLKTSLPGAIRIPLRTTADTPVTTQSSKHATPRTARSQLVDSTYGSDQSMSPPVRPQVDYSPRSDQQQHYHPVRASPHSPLQQRPCTAANQHTAASPRTSPLRPQHLRNQPSRLGGMSMMSVVSTTTPSVQTQGGDGTLKKKRSAFGWLKKAFSMDEEERAAFEARRAMAQKDRYYEPNSPKFLDGRRIR
ncbi:Uncharacterized protein TCAP_04913 [Tolypocladium capitatum]|uniref:Uncharacterized protein n=1 Tax=Tolypocladium capitatum TaxID=45235 RepID=A0A2K3QC81_9HYPO|nr:Uncharacterized protein TCAP_04913 [Tolypocladium capitatum]